MRIQNIFYNTCKEIYIHKIFLRKEILHGHWEASLLLDLTQVAQGEISVIGKTRWTDIEQSSNS